MLLIKLAMMLVLYLLAAFIIVTDWFVCFVILMAKKVMVMIMITVAMMFLINLTLMPVQRPQPPQIICVSDLHNRKLSDIWVI